MGMLDNAVLFSVKICRPGTRRRVASSAVESDADKDLLHVSKEILDAEEFRRVCRRDHLYKQWLKRRVVPVNVFRGGIYPLPVQLIRDVDRETEAFLGARGGDVEEFLAAYPEREREAQKRLRSLYDPLDYPSVAALRAAFRVETAYLALSAPGALRSIREGLFEREARRIERTLQDAAQRGMLALREGLAALVERMVKRLSDRADGRAKGFRDDDPLLGELREFLQLFDARNLAGDGETAELARRADKLLAGLDPEAAKDDARYRERTQKAFAELGAQVGALVVARPKRRLDLDDAE